MTAAYTTRTSCRVCGYEPLTSLFSLGNQFASDFPPPGRARDGPRIPIDLDLCPQCTLVQARHTPPPELLYNKHYWYVSGTTQTMRDALRDVTTAVERIISLKPGDVVLDIGSNDGTLLLSYETPDIALVGVEPADNLATKENYAHKGLNLIHGFWGTPECLERFQRYGKKAKAITACGMFYDLDDPNPFIIDVAKALAPDGVFVAQLMCLKQTLEKHDVGNFAHEHLEFYTLRSLEKLFHRHGLAMFDVEENSVNGGSYRLYAKHLSSGVDGATGRAGRQRLVDAFTSEEGLSNPDLYDSFFRELERDKAKVAGFLREQVAAGKTVYILGASTKGNCIAQYYRLERTLISGASERSPEKVGRVMAGTGIPIVSEEEARAARPDIFLILPYAFVDEIVERERAWLAEGGTFIVPLPTPRLVTRDGEVML